MKAAETNLQRLLEGGKQYSIPLFQRPYSWGQNNWETLWQDILSVYGEDTGAYHFLGPIVTLALPGTPDGISPYVVIDGQQRLTTFSILMAALRDHISIVEANSSLSKEIHDLYLINLFKEGDLRFKILPTKMDLEDYRKIILGKDLDTTSQLAEAYRFFREMIRRGIEDQASLDIALLKRIILQQLTLVHITLDEKDNPYLIFESLNYKGTPLTQADLIRNYFFMHLPREEHDGIYNDVWYPVQKRFEKSAGKNYLEELTNAFWYYLRKDGHQAYIIYNQIYQGIKERNDPCKVDLLVSLDDLLRFAEYYRRFRFHEEEPNIQLKNWFSRFQRLDFTTSYPFLLNLYDNYIRGALSLEELEAMLLIVESYFVRRLFVGIPTNALNKVFNTIYRQIDRNNPVDSLKETLNGYSGSQIWPDNDQFYKSVLERPIYSSSRADRTKLILESLEKAQTKEHVETKELTVEHILPQKLTEEWRNVLRDGAEEKHNKWLHTIGNLTLTAYNPELNNKPFIEKQKFLRDSNLSLNKYFRSVEIWDIDEIKERGANLANLALEIWAK